MSDRVARVLAHPVRNSVLTAYGDGPASASEIARRLGRPLNVVSYHTGVLERYGLLTLVKAERRRGALQRFYRMVGEPHIDDDGWTGLSVRRRRHLVLETLDRIEQETRRAALEGILLDSGSHLSRSPVALDADGIEELSALLRRTFERVTEIEQQARARGDERSAVMVMLLGFALPDRDGSFSARPVSDRGGPRLAGALPRGSDRSAPARRTRA